MTMQTWFHRLSDKLLDAAVAAERKQAKLAIGSAALPSGAMRYFYSADSGAPYKEAIVMIHGAGSDKNSWVRFAARLDNKFPILIPDLPGHGDTPAGPQMNLGIAAQAGYLRTFFAALDVKRIHLIGNSMGGAIALHLAATSPALVVSLIVIDAAGAESTPSWLRTHYGQGGSNPMLDVNDVADYRTMIGIGMSSPPYIPGFLMGSLARRYKARRDINARIERDITADLNQIALLEKIAADTLIIWGAEDRVLHVDDAELLRQGIRNSSKVVLPGLGHVPMVEAPKAVALICKNFYER